LAQVSDYRNNVLAQKTAATTRKARVCIWTANDESRSPTAISGGGDRARNDRCCHGSTVQGAIAAVGGTGTGKELITRAIHNINSRCGRSFVKLNCAAIPLDLLESELVGHEKGAFHRNHSAKIGRFELADKGTLFLDEVGDIPLALQPKLLRVLQQQQFGRLGSTRTHQADVRLVAATNRDLTEMVKRGQFRIDLYYRPHVLSTYISRRAFQQRSSLTVCRVQIRQCSNVIKSPVSNAL
jgi:transcriptional regulator with PAS, ATPase and Fis domain